MRSLSSGVAWYGCNRLPTLNIKRPNDLRSRLDDFLVTYHGEDYDKRKAEFKIEYRK